MLCRKHIALLIITLSFLSLLLSSENEFTTDCDEAREIAKQAYIFAYPMLVFGN